ncbi:tetratricopeptide repeat protein 7B isoform X1 [Halyomorpha halys]|uniref:tetratricopeptide repeat protein 7B isoform X1 n=1 Tax=Halyomorpha halys TaxID=286706 RepID=UPI0006D4E4D7|nr:tetratricopeptide repeat protein 7B isoform X1 [Halyomorpha halys]
MTTKSNKGIRLETDIEKCREEGNWKKVIELSDQLKLKNSLQGPLCNFLLGEGKLEIFLEEYPPLESNISKAKAGLIEAKKSLLIAAGEQGVKAGVSLDAHLLLGKLHYAMGHYEEALKHFMDADLHSLTEKSLPSRSLRIVAESYAVKGLCLEKVPPSSTSKYKHVEWEEQMVKSFELAGDLTLLYLQEQDKIQQQFVSNTGTGTGSHSPQPMASIRPMGPILETALQRAPFLHILAGRLPAAVNKYRSMLSAEESSGTHTLRLILTRQLGEVLIRGFTGTKYTPPGLNGNGTLNRRSGNSSPWKPRVYSGHNLFIPRNECEEIILLLLISEAMAGREAVLSQSPEFKEARLRALTNATAVYDLLTITLVRWGQISLLHESLERALKFSYEESHVWMQRALCLENMGRYIEALAIIKEVVRMQSTKVMPCLLAARMCYTHLNNISEGIEWSEMALQRELSNPQGLLSRCHLYIGIGSHYAALSSHLKTKKHSLNISGFESFNKAMQLDPNDHLVEYYLAISYACNGQTAEAVSHVKSSLKLCPEHAPSLHLMLLLLTAQRQYSEAQSLLKTAISDFPDSLDLHYVKAHLELHIQGPEIALLTAKNMLVIWKNIYEDQTVADNSDNKSVFQLYTSEMSDKDSSSLHAHSLAASRVEQALSEVASSLSTFTPKPGPQRAWLLQLQIWLLLAELYLSMDQIPSAANCIQEAASIYPLSHHIMFTRGLVHEQKREFIEARQCFQNAVSINPSHIKSLQHLGLMYHYLGNQRMAEKVLRDAARIDPHSPKTWYNLGKVLESLCDYSRASDCMATALQVESVSPLLPYTSIPITFE